MVEQAMEQATTAPTANAGARAERITLENVAEAFTYQPWNEDQNAAGTMVRQALETAARVILLNVPETPLRTRALNCLIDARMLANAAITFRGQF